MAYKTEDLFKQAKEIIEGNDMIFFIEDIVAMLPCGSSAFYDHFPADSANSESLKELLTKNKVTIKVKLRNDFNRGKSSVEKIALYKLLATDTERKALSMQQIDITTKDKEIPAPIIWFADVDERDLQSLPPKEDRLLSEGEKE